MSVCRNEISSLRLRVVYRFAVHNNTKSVKRSPLEAELAHREEVIRTK